MTRNTGVVAVLVAGCWLASHGHGWALLAALAVGGVLCAGGRAAAGHSHGGDRATRARHEAGHAAAAHAIGAPIREARLTRDEGYVELRDPEALSSRDYIAFQRAGRYAADTREGCGGDARSVRREQQRMRRAGMSRAQVLAVTAQADADARRYAASPRVAQLADRMEKKGRL